MDYIKLMRPKHYIKNLLIFIPLIFSGLFFDINNLSKTFYSFIIYCLVTSIIYIINDIKDKNKDKKNIIKKDRPLASGRISCRNAVIEIVILLLIVVFLICLFKLPLISILFLSIYFILNLGYSLGLKNIPILDILILASGFVIRVLYGASILHIDVSNWLYLSILSISFYLGLGKRRNEMNKAGIKFRKVLKYYSEEFLDKNMYMFLCMSIIFYSLWAADSNIANKNHNLLIYTIPLMISICMKYSMDIEGDSSGDPVEVILKDKVILLLGFIFVVVIFLILYVW